MKNIYDDIKSTKKHLRKEYNLIRNSNSSLIHEQVKLNVKSALNILLNKYHIEGKYIGCREFSFKRLSSNHWFKVI